MEKSKLLCLSSFILKIIAIVSMTFDHLGVIVGNFYPSMGVFVTICRYIGRLALPLFCFMIAEGVLHTKDIKKYLLRLGIMTIVISTILCVCQYATGLGMTSLASEGNIFMDLFLGALMAYLLYQKDNKG